MSIVKSRASEARRIIREVPDIDQGMPTWARRSNPIVRRQLGMYWRVFPPQIGPLLKWYLILSGVLLVTIIYPVLFVAILTFLLAAATILPYAFYVYVRALALIVSEAATALTTEFQNDTMTLLRTTPFSTMEIILSKISAAVWRRMDDLDQVLMLALWLGLPAITIFYLTRWPPHEQVAVAQVLSVLTFGSTLIRVPLEMFMAASMAAFVGTATHVRSTAILSTGVFLFFYFLLLNLARLLPLSWPMQLLVDAVLPIVLPILISWGVVRLTWRLITRD